MTCDFTRLFKYYTEIVLTVKEKLLFITYLQNIK